jgi:hypothetical protein
MLSCGLGHALLGRRLDVDYTYEASVMKYVLVVYEKTVLLESLH